MAARPNSTGTGRGEMQPAGKVCIVLIPAPKEGDSHILMILASSWSLNNTVSAPVDTWTRAMFTFFYGLHGLATGGAPFFTCGIRDCHHHRVLFLYVTRSRNLFLLVDSTLLRFGSLLLLFLQQRGTMADSTFFCVYIFLFYDFFLFPITIMSEAFKKRNRSCFV